jgi:2-phosphosulfolactate phosphatase
MDSSIEVILAPGEFSWLQTRDKRRTTCVVFDVLRATSTILTALDRGAEAVIPVAEIAEALALRQERPEVLLAGEREGLRIRGAQSGGVDFDFGNSPREFTVEKVRGKTIVATTTNGTRALRASAGAEAVLAGALLNLSALATWIEKHRPAHLLLVCSGSWEEAALEDILAAGALCELVWPLFRSGHLADSAEIARRVWLDAPSNLVKAISAGRNGRRLLAMPDLRDDVAVCAQRDVIPFVAKLGADGALRRDL